MTFELQEQWWVAVVSIVAERGLKGWMVWGEGWVVPENRRDRGRRLGF